MKRLLAISLLGAGLLTQGFGHAFAQTSEVAKDIIWLSCPCKFEGQDTNNIFYIDLKQQGVAKFDNIWWTSYKMQNVTLSEDNIRFSYFTKGSHPVSPDDELLQMVDIKNINNPFETHVTTDIMINRRNLFMRSVKRYYNTILSRYEIKCSTIGAPPLPSHQF
jgi:hypothetical protein